MIWFIVCFFAGGMVGYAMAGLMAEASEEVERDEEAHEVYMAMLAEGLNPMSARRVVERIFGNKEGGEE